MPAPARRARQGLVVGVAHGHQVGHVVVYIARRAVEAAGVWAGGQRAVGTCPVLAAVAGRLGGRDVAHSALGGDLQVAAEVARELVVAVAVGDVQRDVV
ncbi:hypothetical protein [Kutzneria chonburiensis]|uniref:hypothetical protein n=1 Tax=Kutzneria chonburiensis TaxID=1483604 RepID=UPI00235F617F|nr:hypothetical protein [Kutzneria chonburiensis]